MKNMCRIVACLAIASSTAVGCAFETSPESYATEPQAPSAEAKGTDVVQGEPADAAIKWREQGRTLIVKAEAGNWSAYGEAKKVLLKCIELAPHMDECVHMLAIANGPHPGCGLACEAVTVNLPTPTPVTTPTQVIGPTPITTPTPNPTPDPTPIATQIAIADSRTVMTFPAMH